MIPENRIPTHPGEMLLEEFLKPKGTSQKAFAEKLGIPLNRVNEIVNGRRGVTAETAWIFATALGTSPQFWMNLQTAHDLAKAWPKLLSHVDGRIGAQRAIPARQPARRNASKRAHR